MSLYLSTARFFPADSIKEHGIYPRFVCCWIQGPTTQRGQAWQPGVCLAVGVIQNGCKVAGGGEQLVPEKGRRYVAVSELHCPQYTDPSG